MADIVLDAATQAALAATQRTSALADVTRDRLATGNRVNRAADDAPAFFLARALSDRAADLLAVKDQIVQGAVAVGGTVAAIDSLSQIVGQLRGIALAARGGTAAARAQAAAQFDALRGQLGALAADAGFGGVNLLAANPDDLSVALNETGGASLTIAGRASDAAGLGIGTAAADFNGFAADTDIDGALAGLAAATAGLRSTAASFAAGAGVLNIRLAFTEDLTNTLEAGAAGLVNADLNEEAAAALSLRTARALSAVGLSIADDNHTAVLQLLGRDA